VKIECPRCGCENYFTGLEEGAKFCSNCNEPLFEKKIPLFNSFEEISSAALSAIASDKSTKDILAILKQGVRLIGGSTSEDNENMNLIASLLACPRFMEREIAVKFYERIVELEPLNFRALKFLVGFYIMQGRDKDVYQKGNLLLESDYRNGIVKEKEIIQRIESPTKEYGIQNPGKSTSTLYGFLGNFYSDHEEYALAITAFNIALEINPNSIDALNNIAVTYFRKKEYPEALKYYKKCLEVTPSELQKEYRDTVEKYALDPIKAKRLPTAAKANQMIKEAESEILFNIGECLFMLNEIDDARDALRKLIEKSEKFPHRDLSEVVEEILIELRRKHR
jgi:tetratricopeptide (TPR) repeat protein